MGVIELACGATVLIDDDRHAEIAAYAWRLDRHGYPVRATTIDGKKGTTVLLHRVIMRALKGQCVDHINGDPLDNRRENLRYATSVQNGANMRKSQKKRTSSVFKGVTWRQDTGRWQAQLVSNNKRFYLGTYACEHEAGHAYNKKAVEAHGEFAVLNPVGF